MGKILGFIGYFLLDLLETVVIAGAVFVVVYFFAFQPHEVSGESMNGKAGFHTGQYILTDKVTFRLREPERGEVIVFRYPLNPSFDYIKRIIGLPGEKIKVEKNQITIYNQENPNGYILDESIYLSDEVITEANSFALEGKLIDIPQDHYFVMGDNRPHSADSRTWGLVPKDNIIGRSFFRYIPVNEMGLIKNPKYLPQ